MRTYAIQRFTRWEEIERLNIDIPLWRDAGNIAAWAQVAWDDQTLYVRLVAREAAIRAVETGPLGHPWEDSCLEFFFAPVAGDARYINIEFNKNACCCLGLGDGAERTRLIPERDWLNPRAFDLDDGWGIEYRVPFALIRQLFPGFAPGSGDVIRANCYKCGDKTEHEHFLAWSPVTSETPNFHRPQDFGEMRFEG